MLNLKKLSFRLVIAALLLSAASAFTSTNNAVADESTSAAPAPAATIQSDGDEGTVIGGEDEGITDEESADAGEGSDSMPED